MPGKPLRPEVLRKLCELVNGGATLDRGPSPRPSASLENYPACEQEVAQRIDELWGKPGGPAQPSRKVGKGQVIADRQPVAQALDKVAGRPDFTCRQLAAKPFATSEDRAPRVLFFHRRAEGGDIYFVCNQEDRDWEVLGEFRVSGKQPELCGPGHGRRATAHRLPPRRRANGDGGAPATGAAAEFLRRLPPPTSGGHRGTRSRVAVAIGEQASPKPNFPARRQVLQLAGPWEVGFDPTWGGPRHVTFDALTDWTQRAGPASAIAPAPRSIASSSTCRKEIPREPGSISIWARYTTLPACGSTTGPRRRLVAPWRVRILDAVKPGGNRLEITVVNTWVNRLIGDEQEPEDSELVPWGPDPSQDAAANQRAKDRWGVPPRRGGYAVNVWGRGLKDLPDWMIRGEPRPSPHRYTFSSWRYYAKDAPLRPSGLLGPVTVQEVTGRRIIESRSMARKNCRPSIPARYFSRSFSDPWASANIVWRRTFASRRGGSTKSSAGNARSPPTRPCGWAILSTTERLG